MGRMWFYCAYNKAHKTEQIDIINMSVWSIYRYIINNSRVWNCNNNILKGNIIDIGKNTIT